MKLQQVKKYNAKQTKQIMRFVVGSYYSADRTRGWVVSGYCGKDSHKLFNTKAEAIKFIAGQS